MRANVLWVKKRPSCSVCLVRPFCSGTGQEVVGRNKRTVFIFIRTAHLSAKMCFFLREHGRFVPDTRSLEVKDISVEGITPCSFFSSVTQSQQSYCQCCSIHLCQEKTKWAEKYTVISSWQQLKAIPLNVSFVQHGHKHVFLGWCQKWVRIAAGLSC